MPDKPTERLGHDLMTIAEAQYGQPQLEDGGIDRGRIVGVHARRPAREDDRRWLCRLYVSSRRIARHDFRIHVQIANAPRDELSVLGPEIENDNLVHVVYPPCVPNPSSRPSKPSNDSPFTLGEY